MKDVERTANNDGYLSGNYAIVFPEPITGFGKVREKLKQDLLEFIRSTQNLDSSSRKIIFNREDVGRCEIRKVKTTPTRIDPFLPYRIDKGKDGLFRVLEEQIIRKQSRLRNIQSPKILLLCDLYTTADSDMYKACASQLVALPAFHSVFVVQSGGTGFMLYSTDKSWSGNS